MEHINHHNDQLLSIVILLALAVAIVTIFKRLNLSPVLGYFTTGIVLSSGIIPVEMDVKQTQFLAEFGVVFLLFIIGLELSFDKLISMRKHVFGFGSLQVLITGASLGILIYIFTKEIILSFLCGFVLSLSSTAVVLQILTERNDEHTQQGRLSLAILILQDLAFVPLLIMIPLLAADDANLLSAIVEALIKAAIVLVVIVIIGKRLLGPLYRAISVLKIQEIFIATTLLIILATAWFTQEYKLSLALGAFVAGLLVAETEYRTQAETDLQPFKGLLMGLFFISVGMSLDINLVVKHWSQILVLASLVIIFKIGVLYFLARIFKFSKAVSVKSAFLLSQISEFGFVLFALMAQDQVNLIPTDLMELLIAVIALTMAVTPILVSIADKTARIMDLKNPVHYEIGDIKSEISDLKDHIILVSFDKVGKITCDLLKQQHINYVVLDDDPKNVHFGRKNGYPVFYGGCSEVQNLQNLGLKRARMVIIAMGDDSKTSLLVRSVRDFDKNIEVIARAKDRGHAQELREIGANQVLPETFESSVMLGNVVMNSLGYSQEDIQSAISRFRNQEDPGSKLAIKTILTN